MIPAALIGREREVSTVAAMLDGAARLVTVTGPAGVGKTSVAYAVADRVEGAGALQYQTAEQRQARGAVNKEPHNPQGKGR
jgi:Cdc6-like AAA superfamily ATPase